MDVDHFSQYFNNAPVLYIEGRQFKVNVSVLQIIFVFFFRITYIILLIVKVGIR